MPTAKLKEHARRAYTLFGEKPMGDNGNVGVLVPTHWLVPTGLGELSANDAVMMEKIGDEVLDGRKKAA